MHVVSLHKLKQNVPLLKGHSYGCNVFINCLITRETRRHTQHQPRLIGSKDAMISWMAKGRLSNVMDHIKLSNVLRFDLFLFLK